MIKRAPPLHPGDVTARYRWYVVAVLGVAYAANLIDRSMIAILQEPIRHELGLSDAALGVLSGLAFAAFYATLAVPIGRLADRRNRIHVLSAALMIWCIATAACGVATGFMTLLLFRMMVGAGEAGGYPPSASVISDYFPLEKRASALAIYGLGAPLGGMLGLLIGGWLNDVVGWRGAFVIVGLAGLVIAPLLLLTVREPPRGLSDGPDAMARSGDPPAPFRAVVASLWRLRSMRFLLAANMTHGFTHYSFNTWVPGFYIRSFGFTPGTVSVTLSALAALGLVGTWLGGFLADRLGRRDRRWHLWVMAIASTLTVPLGMLMFLAPTANLSFLFAAGPYLLLAVYVGPTLAGVQSLVQSQVRATAAAVMLMTFNLFGLGLGPLLTGALSDLLAGRFGFGAESLRYALAALMLMELVAAGFYLIASRSFRADMARDRSTDF